METTFTFDILSSTIGNGCNTLLSAKYTICENMHFIFSLYSQYAYQFDVGLSSFCCTDLCSKSFSLLVIFFTICYNSSKLFHLGVCCIISHRSFIVHGCIGIFATNSCGIMFTLAPGSTDNRIFTLYMSHDCCIV